MSLALSIENISKRYRLGTFNSGSAADDLRRFWRRRILRQPEPETKVFHLDHGNREGKDLWALRDVSLTVKEGEVLGIVGKNGSGKSTLLKILSQITAPTKGCMRVNGRLASLLEVGTGFNGELTGRENIFLNGTILGMRPEQIRRQFDEIVAFSEIEDFIDTPVKRYSSGMFIRLAFAVAAHLETEIMVIDEVLAVGDVGFQRKCLGKMSDVSSKGRTVLFVSHRMDHITALCPRSILLNAGRLVYDGPTDQVLAQYYQQFQEAKTSNLADRIDRQGRGRVRILDAWVESADGQRANTIVTGQSIVFKLRVKNMEQNPVRNLNAGIAIFSLNNQFLTSVSTNEGGLISFDVDDECIVSLSVPRISLNQGQFYFNASIRSLSGGFEFDDLIENADTLTIDYGDYHGIGQASGGMFSMAHKAAVVELETRESVR
jgi:lipopolysaccharide transport system ATP-binding protein